MMTTRASLVLALLLTGGHGGELLAQQAAPTAPVHLVAELEGRLYYRQPSWLRGQPARVGTILHQGDELIQYAETRAKILCSDLKIVTVVDHVGEVPCPHGHGTLTDEKVGIEILMQGAAADYPRVLSPRRTVLLDSAVILRWQPMDGVDRYRVSVESEGRPIWQREVRNASQMPLLELSGGAALQPGRHYRLVVEGAGRSSNEEKTRDLGFSLVDAAVTKDLAAKEVAIRELGLGEPLATLARAQLYSSHGLRAAAIGLLEGVAGHDQGPQVSLALGNLYLAIALERQAERHYLAVDPASGDKAKLADVDFSLSAVAHEQLYLLYRALGNEDEAQKQRGIAAQQYGMLGDLAKAEQLGVKVGGEPQAGHEFSLSFDTPAIHLPAEIRALLDQGDNAAAIGALEELALRADGRQWLDLREFIAFQYLESGNTDKAMELQRKVVEVRRLVRDERLLRSLKSLLVVVQRRSGGVDLEILDELTAVARELHDGQTEGFGLFLKAQLRLKSQDFSGAEPLLAAAAIAYGAAGNAKEQAATLEDRMHLLDNLGQSRPALAVCEALVSAYRQLGDRGVLADALADLGEKRESLALYDEAITAYLEALDINIALGRADKERSLRLSLSNLFKSTGDDAKAQEVAGQAVATRPDTEKLVLAAKEYLSDPQTELMLSRLMLTSPAPVVRARGHNGLGVVYLKIGAFAAARDAFLTALDIEQRIDARDDQGTTLYNLSSAQRQLRDFSGAWASLGAALALATDLKDTARETAVLNAMAVLSLAQGNESAAFRDLQTALHQARSSRQPADAARIEVTLAALYERRGDTPQAIKYYESALATFIRVADESGEADVRNNLGNLYVNHRDRARAIEQLEPALKIAQRRRDFDLELTVRGNLATCQLLADDPVAARKELSESLKLARGMKALDHEGLTLRSLGVSYLMEQNPSMARIAFLQALPILEQVELWRGASDVVHTLALIAAADGKQAEAADLFKKAMDYGERGRQSEELAYFRVSAADDSSNLYDNAVAFFFEAHREDDAFATSERARGRAFLDLLGSERVPARPLDSPATAAEATLRGEIRALERQWRQERSRPAPELDENAIRELGRRLQKKREDYREALEFLRSRDAEYASYVSALPLSLAEIQGILASSYPDTTLVSYYFGTDETFAFVISADRFRPLRLAVAERDVVAQVNRLQNGSEDPREALAILYGQLAEPLEQFLTTSRIGVIPCRAMYLVPFSALWNGHRYWGDDKSIFYLSSASMLKYLLPKGNKSLDNFLVVAYGETEGLPLLRSREFAQQITNRFAATSWVGPDASEDHLREKARDYGLIHLAVHGELDPDDPLSSHLVLAPAAGAGQDGVLTVDEIYDLNLQKADLVVLGACESQHAAINLGDDLIGMSRAFLSAGTPSILASLWAVNENVADYHMLQFYHFLLEEKAAKAEALQLAQSETRKKYPDPRDWAAFVLTGDPGPARARLH